MECRSCRWFECASSFFNAQTPEDVERIVEESYLASKPTEYGFCRRHAPRPHGGNNIEDVTWPLVWEDEWCGEWIAAKEAKDGR